jgi:hypothetical protein
MAKQSKAILKTALEAVADRGYFNSFEIPSAFFKGEHPATDADNLPDSDCGRIESAPSFSRTF